MSKKRRRVLIGLSGGVDSSVSAYLLKKTGYDVHAIFMLNWKEKGACDWEEDLSYARAVAKQLAISLTIWDFAKEYKKFVFEGFIAAYKKGLTPNPDVFCNKYIKFGSLYDRAIQEGADFVATGHYSQVKNQKTRIKDPSVIARQPKQSLVHARYNGIAPAKSRNNSQFVLCSAVDKTKDQSDFLYQIKPSQLPHILFPVGGMMKSDVKKFAKDIGLPNWNKPESMGVCFIGEMNMKKFLQKYIKPKQGLIQDVDGNELGAHDGVWYYTLGQRGGLNIGGTGPYFVVNKDIRRNTLTVAREPEAERLLMVKSVLLDDVNIFFFDPKLRAPSYKLQVLWRDRHLAPLQKGIIRKQRGKWSVAFDRPKRSVTPGQSLVLYDLKGERVVGGGVITHVQ